MIAWLLLLFVTVPLLELVILLRLAQVIEPLSTLLLVVITGVVGATLARRQGWKTYAKIQKDLAEGTMPTDSLWDAAMIFGAGALLVTPGVLTDLFGFSLLMPPCRRVYRSWLGRWLRSRFRVEGVNVRTAGPRDQVIDSYVVRPSSDSSGSSPPHDPESPTR